jgi:hypothetical protein
MQAFPDPKTEQRPDDCPQDRLPEQAADRHAAEEPECRDRSQDRPERSADPRAEPKEIEIGAIVGTTQCEVEDDGD